MNDTELLDPDFDSDAEPTPCSIPFCNESGLRGVCAEHVVHETPEPDFDPNKEAGLDELQYQHGL